MVELTFKKVYPESARELQEERLKAPFKFTSKSSKYYYVKKTFSYNVSNNFELSNASQEFANKGFNRLDTSKTTGLNKILAKFLKKAV